MTWRGSTTVSDRIFACLAYLLPLINLLVLVAGPLSSSFLSPVITALVIPLSPLMAVYFGFNALLGGFGGLIIFFVLYLLVVRNEAIRHFIRFNVMQAILFEIVLSLFSVIWQFIFADLPLNDLFVQTLFNTIFLGTIAAIGYSVVSSILGRYAEIPTISDAVYMQVR